MSDSIPSLPSPKIRFRDLDLEFLQRQARIWLEIIVGERYDQSISLASLLADGVILRKISSRIWELIQKNGDRESWGTSTPFPEASTTGKHSGRYLPYSNIDTFLKVCQKIGLTGVDLFSPPDVVEEKDIRRVCLCIRALSQKAQARNLKVPNFDLVAHNEEAPTGLVAGFKARTQHLSGESMESKESPDQKGASWSPLMLQKTRNIDRKPSSVETPIIKEADSTTSILISNGDVNGGYMAINGLKPLRSTSSHRSRRSPPSAPCEELSKSTNDFKVNNSDTAVMKYGGFKHNAARRAPVGANDKSHSDVQIKQTLQKVEHHDAAPELIHYASTSSDGEMSSEEISCTIDSYVDTDASQNDRIEGGKQYEQSASPAARSSNGEEGDVQRKPRRLLWRPVVTLAMAVLGAVFILRSREPKLFKKMRNVNVVTHFSEEDKKSQSGDC